MCIKEDWINKDNDVIPAFGEECEVVRAIEDEDGVFYILKGYPSDLAYTSTAFAQIDTDITETVEELELAA